MILIKKIQGLWSTVPLPLRKKIVTIVLFLVACNIGIWGYTVFISHHSPVLLGLVALAYGLGLRHAVDADHIAAIDNTTRKLMLQGKKPVAIGLFFSLGHSTIVVLLSIFVIFSSTFIKTHLPSLQITGTIIGTSLSGFFLLLIGFINLIASLDILRIFKSAVRNQNSKEKNSYAYFSAQGFLSRIFKPLLKIVTNSWQMYFIGFLFGLGFDTASEVGLLSISAISSTYGLAFWEILLIPLSFTAGMVLIDSLDGILMLGAYGWAYIKPIRKLYYNLTITWISVAIALGIGSIEILQLLTSQLSLHNAFFQWIHTLDLNTVGYGIIVLFILSWIISLSVYKMKGYDLIN